MSLKFSRNAQNNRKALLKLNGAGLEKLLESYAKYKDDPDYSKASIQAIIPNAKEYTGTITNNTFEVTGVDLSSAKDKYLVTWNPTTWDTEDNKQNYTLDIQKITTATFSTDTTLTVANNIPTGNTKAIILVTPYLEIKGISDFTFAPSFDDISANTNATGRAKVNDKGLGSFDVTGINGLYAANIIPTQYQLQQGAIPSGALQNVIVTMGKEVGELYFEGTYQVKTFTDSGAVDGGADQAFTCDLQYQNAGVYKKVVTEGDYMSGTIVEEI